LEKLLCEKAALYIQTIRILTVTLSILVICFGLTVLVGWHGHISSLVRYKQDTIAIVHNTALLFILSGFGSLAYVYQFRKTVCVVGVITLIFGILGLMQHIFNIDLNIDQLFFRHYDTIENKFPGRMAPNTAFCFMLSALALLLINNQRHFRDFTVIAAGLGMLIFSLAVVFISGYFTDLEHAYAWGNVTPMSMSTAIGFVLVATDIVFLSWYKAVVRRFELFRFLPAWLTMSIFIATLLVVQKIGEQETINSYASGVPIMVFLVGISVAIFVGLLAHVSVIALISTRDLKDLLSVTRATMDATAEGILIFDNHDEVVAYNNQFLRIWNLTEDKNVPHTRQTLSRAILSQVINKEHYLLKRKEILLHPEAEHKDELKLKSGGYIERYVSPRISNGEIIGRVCCYRDITEQKRLELKLLHLATYDALTDLPNRAYLLDLINRSIERCKKANTNMGLILIDIDKFSQLNDLFGRSKGDALIREVVARLKRVLPNDSMLGRIGGDEFLIIINELRHTENSEKMISKLMKAFIEPFNLFGHEVKISFCIGVAFYPKDGQDTDILLSNSDVALLLAKKEGRNSVQFYSQDMNVNSLEQLDLESQLHRAMEEEQFILHYQPIYDLKTKKLTGVEALVRWDHPQRGLIPPGDFIPMAEEIGLITQLGKWVLFAACKQARQWYDQGFSDLTIAVNISAHQFRYGMLVDDVKEALITSGMNATNLEIELTESVLIDRSEEVSNTLIELSGLGIRISIDDFGTGYSSFSYVKRFPIHKLKIDRAFISDATIDADGAAIVHAMIAMGKNLNMIVLAEGIETKAQLELLKTMGCDQGQGFLFSKPLKVEDCLKFFSEHGTLG
jgi:diguanylate cyclase (GGDEF)-like protein